MPHLLRRPRRRAPWDARRPGVARRSPATAVAALAGLVLAGLLAAPAPAARASDTSSSAPGPAISHVGVRNGADGEEPAPRTPHRSVTAHVIGRSVRGRPITALDFGGATGPGARTVVLIGQIHGDEPFGVRVAARLAGAPSRVPADVHLWVIPTMNPDGAARRDRHNAHGVDLNRNFTTDWARRAKGSRYYGGPRPLSEPEARAVRRFLLRVEPDEVVNLHQPLGGIDTYEAKGHDLSVRLHDNLHLPWRSFSCHGGCTGSLTTWFNATRPGVSIVVEFGRHADRARVRRATTGILKSL